VHASKIFIADTRQKQLQTGLNSNLSSPRAPLFLLKFAQVCAIINRQAIELESCSNPLKQRCTTFCYCRPHYFFLYEVRLPMCWNYIYEILPSANQHRTHSNI